MPLAESKLSLGADGRPALNLNHAARLSVPRLQSRSPSSCPGPKPNTHLNSLEMACVAHARRTIPCRQPLWCDDCFAMRTLFRAQSRVMNEHRITRYSSSRRPRVRYRKSLTRVAGNARARSTPLCVSESYLTRSFVFYSGRVLIKSKMCVTRARPRSRVHPEFTYFRNVRWPVRD